MQVLSTQTFLSRLICLFQWAVELDRIQHLYFLMLLKFSQVCLIITRYFFLSVNFLAWVYQYECWALVSIVQSSQVVSRKCCCESFPDCWDAPSIRCLIAQSFQAEVILDWFHVRLVCCSSISAALILKAVVVNIRFRRLYHGTLLSAVFLFLLGM